MRTRDATRVVRALPARFARAVDGSDAIDLALVMTSLTLLLDPKTTWQMRTASSFLCSAALLHRPLLRRPELWIALAAVLGWMNLASWYAIDNHKYLLSYWLFALALGLTTSGAERPIAFNARVLVGLAFLLATAQKIISPDFLNGSFLGESMLADRRFQPLGEWIAGLSPDDFEANSRALQSLVRFDSELTVVPLYHADRVIWIARAMAWWTVAIEGFVALAFLWPVNRGPSRWRDAGLIAFIFTTYAVATVATFGWLLTAMGISQTTGRYRKLGYVVAFLVVALYWYPRDLVEVHERAALVRRPAMTAPAVPR